MSSKVIMACLLGCYLVLSERCKSSKCKIERGSAKDNEMERFMPMAVLVVRMMAIRRSSCSTL